MFNILVVAIYSGKLFEQSVFANQRSESVQLKMDPSPEWSPLLDKDSDLAITRQDTRPVVKI